MVPEPWVARAAGSRCEGDTPVSRARVLLVDDHPAILHHLQRLLAEEFDVVGVAEDGESALAALAQLKPDVVVLDLSMPDMSGFDIVHQLNQSGSQTRVVFLTVHDDPDFAREAITSGGMGYVVKQSLASDLVHAIREALAGRGFVSDWVALEDGL